MTARQVASLLTVSRSETLVPQSPDIHASQPAGGSRWIVHLTMLGMSLMYCWSFFQRVAVPGTLFEPIQADLHWSASQVTALASIYLFIYAGGQLITGVLADRFGGARVILVGSVLLSIGALGFPLGRDINTLYALRALVGAGATVMFLCTIRELATRYDARSFTRLVGPISFVGGLGSLLATAPTAWSAERIGWRSTLLIAGALTALTTLGLAALLLRSRGTRPAVEPITWTVCRAALLNGPMRPLLFVGPITFVCYFLFQAVVGQKYLRDVTGCGQVAAAGVTLAMQLTSSSLMIASGALSALFGHRRRPAVIVTAALVIVGLLLLCGASALNWPLPAHIAGLLLLAAANGFLPLLTCALREITPGPALGVVIGVLNTMVYLAVALGSKFAGAMLDAYEPARTGDVIRYPSIAYTALVACLIPLAIVSLLASLFMREPNAIMQADRQPPPDG